MGEYTGECVQPVKNQSWTFFSHLFFENYLFWGVVGYTFNPRGRGRQIPELEASFYFFFILAERRREEGNGGRRETPPPPPNKTKRKQSQQQRNHQTPEELLLAGADPGHQGRNCCSIPWAETSRTHVVTLLSICCCGMRVLYGPFDPPHILWLTRKQSAPNFLMPPFLRIVLAEWQNRVRINNKRVLIQSRASKSKRHLGEEKKQERERS